MANARRASRFLAALLAAVATCASAAPGLSPAIGFDGTVRRATFVGGVRAALEAGLRSPAYRLWAEAGYGLDRSEHAAWVVSGPEGPAWREWPWDRQDLKSRWSGATPAGAVAIVHTHPAVVDARPSFQDRETAKRLRIDVYTVSRSGIWKAGPDGRVTRVWDERWWVGCGPGNSCRESVSIPFSLADAGNRGKRETAAHALRITE